MCPTKGFVKGNRRQIQAKSKVGIEWPLTSLVRLLHVRGRKMITKPSGNLWFSFTTLIFLPRQRCRGVWYRLRADRCRAENLTETVTQVSVLCPTLFPAVSCCEHQSCCAHERPGGSIGTHPTADVILPSAHV